MITMNIHQSTTEETPQPSSPNPWAHVKLRTAKKKSKKKKKAENDEIRIQIENLKNVGDISSQEIEEGNFLSIVHLRPSANHSPRQLNIPGSPMALYIDQKNSLRVSARFSSIENESQNTFEKNIDSENSDENTDENTNENIVKIEDEVRRKTKNNENENENINKNESIQLENDIQPNLERESTELEISQIEPNLKRESIEVNEQIIEEESDSKSDEMPTKEALITTTISTEPIVCIVCELNIFILHTHAYIHISQQQLSKI